MQEGGKMHAEKLDKIDIQLLNILQQRGRTKRNVLAEKVGLSIPSVSERLRKMEDAGYIIGFRAILDPHKIGLGVTAFVYVLSESSGVYPSIIEKAKNIDEILECHAVTGDGSHLLKIRTRDTTTLEKLLSEIQAWKGVKNTKTNIVLSSPKETTFLSLK